MGVVSLCMPASDSLLSPMESSVRLLTWPRGDCLLFVCSWILLISSSRFKIEKTMDYLDKELDVRWGKMSWLSPSLQPKRSKDFKLWNALIASIFSCKSGNLRSTRGVGACQYLWHRKPMCKPDEHDSLPVSQTEWLEHHRAVCVTE